MSEKITKKIELFTQLTTQILVLSTAGIAAGVAFLQIDGVKGWPAGLVIVCFIFFIASLVSGVLGLMVVIGQIDEAKPDFNQGGVRWPNLLAILFFGIGLFLFLIAAVIHFYSTDTASKPERVAPTVVANPPSTPNDELLAKIKNLNSIQLTALESFISSGFKECVTANPKPVATHTKENPASPPKKAQKRKIDLPAN